MLETKATDTHSEYVILIAFAQQQWLRERAFILRYKYIVSLVHAKCGDNVTYTKTVSF